MKTPAPESKQRFLERGARCEECPLLSCRSTNSKVQPTQRLGIIGKYPVEEEIEQQQIAVGSTGRKIRGALRLQGIPEWAVQFNSLVLCRPPVGFKMPMLNKAIDCCKPRLARDLATIRTVLCGDAKANQLFTGKTNEMDWFGYRLPGRLVEGKGKKVAKLWEGQAMPAFQPAKAFSKPSLWPVFYACLGRAWALASDQAEEWKDGKIVFGVGKDVQRALRQLSKATLLGVDIENTGDPIHAPITAIGIASRDLWVSVDWTKAPPHLKKQVRALLESDIPKTLHNGAFDIVALDIMAAIIMGGFAYDTMLMHTAVAADASHKLSFVAACLLDAPRWKAIFGDHKDTKGETGMDRWKRVDDELLIYNARDAGMTVLITEALLAGHMDSRSKAHAQTLLDLSLLGIQMQRVGVAIDGERVRFHWRRLRRKERKLHNRMVAVAAELGFPNYRPTAGRDSRKLFFDVLKAKPRFWSQKTKQPSLHAKALRAMLTDEPLVRTMAKALLDYTSTAVLRRNTVRAMMGKTELHPTPKVNGGGATGRWSYKPAMQNWQKPLRDIIVARPGYVLVEGDKMQLEARVAAALNKEPRLIEAIEKGLNIHKVNLKNIFNKDKEGNEGLYKLTKTAFFASLYLAATRTTWERLVEGAPGLTLADVQRFQDAMFAAYPRLKLGAFERVRQAAKDDYIEIPGSRHRYHLYGDPPSPNLCANIPVQGFGAHRMNQEGLELGKRIDWVTHRLLLQIHDAYIWETKDPAALMDLIHDVQDRTVDFGNGVAFPLPVEIQVGLNWAPATAKNPRGMRGVENKEQLAEELKKLEAL